MIDDWNSSCRNKSWKECESSATYLLSNPFENVQEVSSTDYAFIDAAVLTWPMKFVRVIDEINRCRIFHRVETIARYHGLRGAIKRSTLRFIIVKLIKKWETRDRPFRSVNWHWPSKNLRATFGCKINHSFRTLSLPASVHSNPSIYLISPVGEVLSVADGISIHSRAWVSIFVWDTTSRTIWPCSNILSPWWFYFVYYNDVLSTTTNVERIQALKNSLKHRTW